MTKELYTEMRANLVREFWFLKSKRLYMSAKARVRKIADLDLEYSGTPREYTYQKFNYSKIGSKGV
jgi:hypothetical protein